MEDIRFVPEGVVIRIHRSKTDQIRLGRNVVIPFVKGRHCPVRVLKDWLEKSRIKTGTIFRSMNRFDQLMDQGLCAPSVALIIKQRVADAGFNSELYSGHSLRAGLVTSASSTTRR